MFKRLVVTNKASYLCLLLIPIAVLKFFIYDINYISEILTFGFHLFLSLMIAIIGIYLFIRFNTHSALLNPDHPKK